MKITFKVNFKRLSEKLKRVLIYGLAAASFSLLPYSSPIGDYTGITNNAEAAYIHPTHFFYKDVKGIEILEMQSAWFNWVYDYTHKHPEALKKFKKIYFYKETEIFKYHGHKVKVNFYFLSSEKPIDKHGWIRYIIAIRLWSENKKRWVLVYKCGGTIDVDSDGVLYNSLIEGWHTIKLKNGEKLGMARKIIHEALTRMWNKKGWSTYQLYNVYFGNCDEGKCLKRNTWEKIKNWFKK